MLVFWGNQYYKDVPDGRFRVRRFSCERGSETIIGSIASYPSGDLRVYTELPVSMQMRTPGELTDSADEIVNQSRKAANAINSILRLGLEEIPGHGVAHAFQQTDRVFDFQNQSKSP